MKGEVDIMVNFPISTSLKTTAQSAMSLFVWQLTFDSGSGVSLANVIALFKISSLKDTQFSWYHLWIYRYDIYII